MPCNMELYKDGGVFTYLLFGSIVFNRIISRPSDDICKNKNEKEKSGSEIMVF